MKIKIYKSPRDYDSDDCTFINEEGQEVGSGYIPRDPEATTILGLINCPACRRENYAMTVSTGMCSWCGWDANPTIRGCLHNACTQCAGTGVKKDGTGMCIHGISCPCPKCNVMC